MVTIIAISSLKGGVGKTTLSINLAFAFSQRGWKTLLVDADPQGSVGLSLTKQAQARPGFYELTTGPAPLAELILKTRFPNFSILTMGQFPVERIPEWSRQMEAREAWSRLRTEAESQGYEAIIIDTPSGLHGPAHGALSSASHVVVPVLLEPLASRSLQAHLTALGKLRENGGTLQLAGLVGTMYDESREESRVTLQDLRQTLPPGFFFDTVVPQDPLFLKASLLGSPIGLLQQSPTPMSLIFDLLATELEARVGLISKVNNNEFIPLLD